MGGSFTPDPMALGYGWLTAIDASTGAIRWRYRDVQLQIAVEAVPDAGEVERRARDLRDSSVPPASGVQWL
jgi:hypothetical protein